MGNSRKLTCFLMGGQDRLIQCAEILLQKGHQILGIISDDPLIRKWGKENSLPLIMPNDDFLPLLKKQPFDLFCSIINFWTVPKEVLTLPQKYAINFHDSPLPRCAGVHATNWAIMNRESIHAITWHIMTEEIDAGDILKQKTFPISEGETAMSLNAKCYEKSIEGFAELIDELAEDRVKPIQQDLRNRTYFGRWKRPHAACVIDWSRSAEEVNALFRGLDFGTYPNPLGLPKLFLGSQVIVAKEVRVLESRVSEGPGTITRVTDRTMNVATATREVAIGEFTSWNGEQVAPSNFLAALGLGVGDTLPKLEGEDADKITRVNSKLCRHEDFWIQRLADVEPIEIPYARRYASRGDTRDRLVARVSTPEQVLTTWQGSKKPGDFLLTALAIYLYRIGGKESFDLNYKEIWLQEQLSGTEAFFASHVPIRIELDSEKRFGDLHRAIQHQIQILTERGGSYARDLPLRHPSLREALKQSSSSTVQVTIERVQSLSDYAAKPDADLTMVIPDDGKECLWLYDGGFLEETAIDRMREQFTVLLEDIGSGQDRFVSQFSILPEKERHMLLTEWRGGEKEYPQRTTLHKRFEAQVERTPDAHALVFGTECLTYRQLNRRANQVAYRLRELGVGPETLVGLCVERSLEMVIGILGILKAGGAYVPLDPVYPQERLGFMLGDAQVPVVVTQERLMAKLPAHSAKVFYIDAAPLGIGGEDTAADENPVAGANPEHLAYVIYTSGSTGKPKGVLVTHGNVTRLFDATEPWYSFGPKDVWTMFHSYAFDFSVWEIWGALLYGGQLVIIPYEVSRFPKEFRKLLVDQNVTVLNQTPSAFYQLIQAEETGEMEGDLSLRLVIFGGEALELKYLKPWFKHHGDKTPQLVNMYGITETTVHVTYRPLTFEDVESGQGSVIGEPIPDLQLYVLDGNLVPVPVGVAGELYVGGGGLGRGYLNRPELTMERFIPDPFSKKPGARLYKSGDVARFLPNRDLEYLGRADQQVQIRGFRVELGEIESVLAEHETIGQVVVVVREDRPGDQRLVAYFVPALGHGVNIPDLRKHLRARLPEYMIPQYFVELEVIPLTPNGKVDRRALPEPTVDRQTEESYVASRSEVEKTIASIWQELLNIKNVGIHDNFFELGGHSLLLVRMLARLQKTFGKELSIVEMFRHPTVAALGSFLAQKEKKEPSLGKAFDLAKKQKESLKRQKRVVVARRNLNG
jgi:amino acid adenylation domain-containing protein